jgi:UDP-N-acetylglucosamine 3-dehydrogenase
MKIGIISFAHMHAYSYAQAVQKLENVQIAGIFDEDPVRGEKMAVEFQTIYYSSYQSLLEQDIEAVIVTSENIKHEDHVIAAAQAKKHVLCEKPLSTTVESAHKMIKACEDNGVLLQIAFPMRFNTNVKRAKELIDQGNIGRILAMRGTNRGRNPGGWFVDPLLSGGGAVIDHTVHVVDIMRWFSKSEVKEVYAESDQLFSEIPIDDAGVLTFEFESGIFGTLDCSWSRNKTFPTWGDVTIEIVGTLGTLSVDGLGQNICVYSDEQGNSRRFWGDDSDFSLIYDFLLNVKEKKIPSVTGFDGLKAVEVALAAYQSSEKHLPVTIGEKNF